MAKGDPVRIGDALVIIMDQAGGFYRIDTAKLQRAGGAAWLVRTNALAARPAGPRVHGVHGPDPRGRTTRPSPCCVRTTRTAATARPPSRGPCCDERVCRTAARPAGPAGRLRARCCSCRSRTAILPARLTDPRPRPKQGPPGAANGCRPRRCYLAPIDDDELSPPTGPGRSSAGMAGGEQVVRKNGRAEAVGTTGGHAGRAAASPPRVVVADAQGKLTMSTATSSRCRRCGSGGPSGRTYCRPARSPRACGSRRRPTGHRGSPTPSTAGSFGCRRTPDKPEWVGPTPIKALAGRPVIDGKRHPPTDRAGVVRVIDMQTGKETRRRVPADRQSRFRVGRGAGRRQPRAGPARRMGRSSLANSSNAEGDPKISPNQIPGRESPRRPQRRGLSSSPTPSLYTHREPP